MAQPLIIFGAGASYDYSSEGQEERIAPLTKNLVDEKYLQADLLKKYDGVGSLLTDAVYQVRNGTKGFEEVLTMMQQRTPNSIPMRRQFIALEFYLRDLFQLVSNPDYHHPTMRASDRLRMQEMNHYRSIINRINNYTGGKACVVTFNYDSLFEDSLSPNLIPKKMSDYISNEIKLIKLHGSHNWSFIHRKSEQQKEKGTTSFDMCLNELNLLGNIRGNDEYRPYHSVEIEESGKSGEFHKLPALAIPLLGKDSFISPKEHIEQLGEELQSVDRVLVIGWRAKDPLLLDLLKKHLPQMGYRLLVVSDSLDGAKEISKTIQKNIGVAEELISARGGGFKGFVSDEISHTFFADN